VAKKPKKIPIKLNEVIVKEIDFKTQKVVSFSQFQMWHQCPHKWANRYVRSIKKDKPTINLCFGTAIHKTLQDYLKTMYGESGAAADRLNMFDLFQESFIEEYQKTKEDNKGINFSDAIEMQEFYDDGVAILDWFKKNRRKYFDAKGTYLVGIEMPLQKEVKKNVLFTGSIDFILYDERVDKIYVYDIKTSTKGWNDWNKKDDSKTSQLLLYKQYFSELYGFDVNRIEVEFFIVKRKIQPNEFQEFPKRVQTFSPAAGKIKMNQAKKMFEEFINDGFDENGKLVEKEYTKNKTKLCEWCPYYKTEYCNAHDV
jgi:hypothetical protein